MIQRDYILRMIEELRRILAAIVALKEEQRWQEVEGTLEGAVPEAGRRGRIRGGRVIGNRSGGAIDSG